MRILVTGCDGFIGSRICRSCCSGGHTVLGVDPCATQGICYPSDVCQSLSYEELCSWRPDKIVLCGAVKGLAKCTESVEALRRNVFDLEHYLQFAMNNRHTQVVFLSSDMVFGGWKVGAPFPEDHSTRACNAYGAMKIAGEQLVLTIKNSTVVRTALVVGRLRKDELKRQQAEIDGRILSNQSLFYYWLARKIAKDNMIHLPRNVFSTPTLVDDLVEDVMKILCKGLRGVFHSCGPRRMSRAEMAKEVLGPYAGRVFEYDARSKLRPCDVALNFEMTRSALGGENCCPSKMMRNVVWEVIGNGI